MKKVLATLLGLALTLVLGSAYPASATTYRYNGGSCTAGGVAHNADGQFIDYGNGSGDVGLSDLYNGGSASTTGWFVTAYGNVVATYQHGAFTGQLLNIGWPGTGYYLSNSGGLVFYVKWRFTGANGHTCYIWLDSNMSWSHQDG